MVKVFQSFVQNIIASLSSILSLGDKRNPKGKILARVWHAKTKIFLIMACAAIIYATDWHYRNDLSQKLFNSGNETFLYKIESKVLDAKFNLRGVEKPTGKVGILAADEETITKFGDWPIRRKFYGPALRNLQRHGVKVVGFDAFFPEVEDTKLIDVLPLIESVEKSLKNPSRLKAQRALHTINRLKPMIDRSAGDLDFANAVSGWEGVILGFASFKLEFEAREQLGDDQSVYFKDLDIISQSSVYSDIPSNLELKDLKSLNHVRGMKSNFPELNHAARNFAFFDNDADLDSINRWVTMVQNYEGILLPSLSLKAAALSLDMPLIAVTLNDLGVAGIDLINEETEEIRHLTTDPYYRGQILINHRGPGKTFPHFSLQDAYFDTFTNEERKKLKGMTLLYGGTATGTQDLRPNPFDPAIDGVENHAAMVDNILAGDFLTRKASFGKIKLFGFEFFVLENHLMILLGFLFAPFVIWASSLISAGAMLAFIGGLILYDWRISFLQNHEWHFIVLPCAQLFTMFITCNFFRFVVEEQEKRVVKGAFEHYLSPDVIKQVLADPSSMALGGTRRDITVFFSDVRSFTAISEGLSPEKLTQFMNLYFEPMTSIILKSGGTLDKYIGDAIMAFWGAPVETVDHPVTAARAAIEMMHALDKLQKDLPAMGFPKPDIGIGLNSGPASVGNMGSSARFSYTALGDSVNLGARLEGVTKEYKVKILMSEYTAKHLNQKDFFYRDMDMIKVKGKDRAVRIYELMRPDYCGEEQRVRDLIGEFELARVAYLKQDWQNAERGFLNCLNIHPEDGPSSIYLEIVAQLRQNPPGAEWNGVRTMMHK